MSTVGRQECSSRGAYLTRHCLQASYIWMHQPFQFGLGVLADPDRGHQTRRAHPGQYNPATTSLHHVPNVSRAVAGTTTLIASQMHPPKCTPTPSPSPAVPPRRVYTRRQQVSVRERAPPFLLLSFGSCSPFGVTCTRYSQIDPGVYRRAYPGQANLYSG